MRNVKGVDPAAASEALVRQRRDEERQPEKKVEEVEVKKPDKPKVLFVF